MSKDKWKLNRASQDSRASRFLLNPADQYLNSKSPFVLVRKAYRKGRRTAVNTGAQEKSVKNLYDSVQLSTPPSSPIFIARGPYNYNARSAIGE